MSKPRVFVSYVQENRTVVLRLVDELRQRGVDVWFDRDTLPPGVFWRDEIRNAVREHGYFVACFSSEYAARDRTYMNEELELAIAEIRLRGASRWFIPVVLSGEVPDRSIGAGRTLRDIQYVDLSEPNWNNGVSALATAVGARESHRRARPTITSQPPVKAYTTTEAGQVYPLPEPGVRLSFHVTGPDTYGEFYFSVSNGTERDIFSVRLSIEFEPFTALPLELGDISADADSRFVSMDEASVYSKNRKATDKTIIQILQDMRELTTGNAQPNRRRQVVMTYLDYSRVARGAIYTFTYRRPSERGVPSVPFEITTKPLSRGLL